MRERIDSFRRHGQRLFTGLCSLAWVCGGAQNGLAQTKGGFTPAPQIASVEGGVEAAIDAPWRLEPDPTSTPRYPTIPIIVSIHDSTLQSTQGPSVALGVFCEMAIREGAFGSPTEYRTADTVSEVERSDKWPLSSAVAANHRLCRRWAGEACSAADLDVGPSAEWHGTVLYTPKQQTPGADVQLEIQVRVARAGYPCGAPKPIFLEAPFDRLASHPYDNTSYLITNRVLVHLGEEPLPRFDDGWAYGDLHYHSQGTDNEGESAYAYRPVLQAMRAMGLDFLFATDHASDSGQITDLNVIYLKNLDVPDWIPFNGDIENFLESIPLHEETRTYAARDMNQQRFETMRAWLNDGPGAANAEVLKAPGRSGAPRIFLGGEVDVVPEMSAYEKGAGRIFYGNGVAYTWRNCLLDPTLAQKIADFTTSLFCPTPDVLAELDPGTGHYLVKDIQGLGDDSFYARQHMVYLPTDGTRNDAFVSSRTTQFGGGYMRLKDLLNPTFYNTIVGKGYAFLAHPVDYASGSGAGRLGPDMVPYSDVQLRTAFESPSILGLQLWNEDSRLRSSTAISAGMPGFPLQYLDGVPAWLSRWLWRKWLGPAPDRAYSDLHHGLAMWDQMLLWGIRPSQTAGLSWLAPGEPRRVFMAGGSDAHGDWNYRREGRLGGVSAIVDTGMGKPRNLVFVGSDRPESVTDRSGAGHGTVGQAQVTSALATGEFAVTDGPALRIALDANENGVIDDADVPMGGVTNTPYRGAYVPFLVEWKSTDEFGPLAGIDLYVGVTKDTLDEGLVYAPANHGIHSAFTKSGAVKPNPYIDAAGGSHPELWDGYLLDPTGRLHITPTAAEAKAGRKLVYLRANDFVMGRRRVEQEEPVCELHCKPGYTDECEETCTTPPPPTYHFDNVSLPDRIFVRAFARTAPKGGALCAPGVDTTEAAVAQESGQCIERLAFTNPIWVDNTVTAPPPGDFSLACSPSSLSLPTAGSRTSTCTVTSTNGFSKAVSLGCASLPSGISCSFSPAALTPPSNGSVSSTLTVNVGLGVSAGSYTFQARGTTTNILTGHTTNIALTVGGSADGPIAVFDPTRQAPSCRDQLIASCDTGGLVVGRAADGREANAPNTIAGTCPDGTSGPLSGRWDANDRIRVSTTDGTKLSPGKAVRIDATVWTTTPTDNAVDFFYAADATRPTWTLIGTVMPTIRGAQTLSAGYRLPSGSSLQAVRVQFRLKSSTNAACAVGAFNDRDDLVFAVDTSVP